MKKINIILILSILHIICISFIINDLIFLVYIIPLFIPHYILNYKIISDPKLFYIIINIIYISIFSFWILKYFGLIYILLFLIVTFIFKFKNIKKLNYITISFSILILSYFAITMDSIDYKFYHGNESKIEEIWNPK
tara:strand:- start:690 stop:1100 length:411 start_codon:yes stop_codon:yes gene_type:complete